MHQNHPIVSPPVVNQMQHANIQMNQQMTLLQQQQQQPSQVLK